MHQVTIHEAKTHLSRLIQEVLGGEEVIVARGKVPLVRMTALKGATIKRTFGAYKGVVKRMDKNFDAPLPDFQEYTR